MVLRGHPSHHSLLIMPKTKKLLSRRDFLKLVGLGTLGAAVSSLVKPEPAHALLEGEEVGRITADILAVRREPTTESRTARYIYKDDLMKIPPIVEVVNKGIKEKWYQLAEDEYCYAGFMQPVKCFRNVDYQEIPANGCVAEVTMPWADVYASPRGHKYDFRYYYQSTQWVTQRVFDGYGVPWYEVSDDWDRRKYYVRAYTLRIVSREELTPLGTDVSSSEKSILIDLDTQTMVAFERKKEVYQGLICTGMLPGYTPNGEFEIFSKRPSRRMVSDEGYQWPYDLPCVPWVSYFTQRGVAFHGVYWHSNWGHRMSNGCINMPPEEAKWLYRWTEPSVPFERNYYETLGGTKVKVIGKP